MLEPITRVFATATAPAGPARARAPWIGLASVAAIGAGIVLVGVGRGVEPGGRRPTMVEAFGAGAMVAQTFAAPGDGLEGVTVFVRGGEEGGPGGRTARLTLLARRDGGYEPLYSRAVGLDGRAISLAFPLLDRSAGAMFRIDLQLVGPPSGPLALEAFADGGIRPGIMAIDGREQWGDLRLRFQLASPYRAFVARVSGMPAWLLSPAVHLALAVAYIWALVLVTDGLLWDRKGGSAADGDGRPSKGDGPSIEGERWGRTS